MHWSVCFPVLILVGTGWWTWQAYLSDPPWYAYPIAAGITCSLSNLAPAESQATPSTNQTVAVAHSGTHALTGPSFGFFQAKDGSVQLKPKGFFENFSHLWTRSHT